MTESLFNFVLFTLAILFLSLASTAIYNSYVNNRQLRFNQSYMLSNLVIDIEAISEMFDILIDSCFIEYFLFDPVEEGTYMNAEMEKKIATDITSSVISRITAEILSKLRLIYIIDTEEELSDIVAKKVYLRVTDFIVSNNKPTL